MEENKEPIISQPTDEEQRNYVSLRDNDATIVRILGTKKTYKLRWVKKGQLVKLSRLLVHKGDTDNEDKKEEDILSMIIADSKLSCKAAAIYILDGYWKLLFLYPLLWRWFYYVKQYDDIQLKELLEEGKKKVRQNEFFIVTMSLIGAKATLMTMTAKEAEHTLQELSLVQQSQGVKNDSGSVKPDISSSDS